MFERFTEKAIKVIMLAQEEARLFIVAYLRAPANEHEDAGDYAQV